MGSGGDDDLWKFSRYGIGVEDLHHRRFGSGTMAFAYVKVKEMKYKLLF